MIITDKLIKDFTAETKLKLHKEADNKYYECSGKSLPTIQSRIMKYNKGRDIKAFVVRKIFYALWQNISYNCKVT